MIYKKTLS